MDAMTGDCCEIQQQKWDESGNQARYWLIGACNDLPHSMQIHCRKEGNRKEVTQLRVSLSHTLILFKISSAWKTQKKSRQESLLTSSPPSGLDQQGSYW